MVEIQNTQPSSNPTQPTSQPSPTPPRHAKAWLIPTLPHCSIKVLDLGKIQHPSINKNLAGSSGSMYVYFPTIFPTFIINSNPSMQVHIHIYTWVPVGIIKWVLKNSSPFFGERTLYLPSFCRCVRLFLRIPKYRDKTRKQKINKYYLIGMAAIENFLLLGCPWKLVTS